ncbi:MAG: hypothetical protein QME25_09700 [Bacteroidota bacterium]|jgi:hypothetical protein|nr:hypothetical protein [Bacteroidota bacterium]MDI6780436.1 hypothetical protein [Bacteroidota bacterium]
MIAVFIFYLHVVAFVTIFTKRWQESGTVDACLSAGFMLLIFGVGWSVSTVILKFFFDARGLGIWFDRDAMSLVLLTLMEGVFYYAYAKRERQKIT